MVRFCSDAMQLVFLLNRRYAPFYKWLHRAVGELPLLGPAVQAHVAVLLDDRSAATRAARMEEIAALLVTEIRRQGLSDSASDFLLDHAPLVQATDLRPGAPEPPLGRIVRPHHRPMIVRYAMTQRDDTIARILEIELEMFLAVNGADNTSCQEHPDAFKLHRRAQFARLVAPDAEELPRRP